MTSLTTHRLVLRPFKLSDVQDVAEYAVNPEFYRYLPVPEQTSETVRAFVEERVREQEGDEGERLILAVVLSGSERVIGTIRLDIQQLPVPMGSLGFSMDPSLQGHFYMVEPATRVLEHAFKKLGLVRVWSSTDVENARGNRVMEQIGMSQSKRIEGGMTVRGEPRDVFHYTMDAADFAA